MNNLELIKLKHEITTLKDEAEIARRLAAFEYYGKERERIYRFIQIQQANYTVTTLCRVCKVSRSSYYVWSAKKLGPTDDELIEAVLANEIYDIWKKSRGAYGAPRITAQLQRSGQIINGKKVVRIMAEIGISGISGRRKMCTTRRDPTREPAKDLVERDFSATEPDELLVGDITYIPTDEGWLFLASVLDVCSRRLIGWSMADHMRTELCLDALWQACATRNKIRFVDTIFHSDKGCQYTAEKFDETCQLMGIIQSMGSVGDSYDNAMAESLWASLKRELVDNSKFATRQEAREAIFEWIIWYNNERLHSSLGYMSPREFEESFQAQQAA